MDSMPKVCVVTFFKHNYGAFLQAYALQRVLLDLGCDAEVLDYDYARDRTFLGIPCARMKNPLVFLKMVAYRLMRGRVQKQIDLVFQECAGRLIRQTRYYRTYKEVKASPPEADVYLVGSDQVWNPELAFQGVLSRLLDFVPSDTKVLASFAASMGKTVLSPKEKELFKANLKRFDGVSVRESSSVAALSGLTDKPMEIHKDPALLLSSAEWDSFAQDIHSPHPYLFLYLVQNDSSLVAGAKQLAQENGWGIVACQASANYSIRDSLNGNAIFSPPEFVGGIRGAEYVVTNSFHCLVFTIHYGKRAFVKFPPRGADRLRELVDAMGLQRLTEDRLVQPDELPAIYARVRPCLEAERLRAHDYLRRLLDIARQKKDLG